MKFSTFFAAVTLVFGVLSTPVVAQGQQVDRIGFLRRAGPIPVQFEAFQQGLRELGYIEGKNLLIEQRYAAGDYDRLPALATELVQLNLELIVVDGASTARVIKDVTPIPIVFVLGDPIVTQLVDSLAHPGGNITGITTFAPELLGKRLELLKEVVDTPVAVLANPTSPTYLVEQTRTAAQSLELSVQFFFASRPDELADVFSTLTRQNKVALVTLPDAMFHTHHLRIVELTAKHRLPAVFPEREFAEAGGLMAYGPNVEANFAHAATYVDKILKGAHPRDLPVQQPTKIELLINLSTANALKLAIPPSLLARADELIE